MFPILIDLGSIELPVLGHVDLYLPTYGVLVALAALVAWWWLVRRGQSLGVPSEKLFNLCLYSLLAGIVGAKAMLIAVDWRYYLRNPVEVVGTLRSAGVLIGGVIAGAVVFIAYARRHGLPVLRLADAAAAPLALSQSIGRLGCFSAGCCYGVPADPGNPLALTFTNPVASANTGVPLNVPLVPTQLIQMINDLVLALVLTWLWRRRPEPAGTVFWWYILLYGLTRGTIEFWRGDMERGFFFGSHLSTSQLLSLAGVVFAVIMLLRGRVRRKQAAAA